MLGKGGRLVFATATLAFIVLSICVIGSGVFASANPPAAGVHHAGGGTPLLLGAGLGPAVLAIPLGMALATGVEAPSNAVALRLTLWLMVGIVGVLTIAFAALAVGLGSELPPADSTLIAEVARDATGGGFLFAAFQASSALLLLSAAASSYLAGSGVLKALATLGRDGEGLVPSRFGRINRFLSPEWGVALVLVAAAVLVAASGREQRLVGFYAVAVFASFGGDDRLCPPFLPRRPPCCAGAQHCRGGPGRAIILGINATRLDGLIALLTSGGVAAYLFRIWVSRGRPKGVAVAGVQ